MTGISWGHWSGTFVAVCDPEPPPTRRPERQEPHRARFDGEHLIEAARAAELSEQALAETGLSDRDPWRRVLDGTELGRPVLVQRLDHNDSFYWIVPRGRGGVTTVVVNIDARYGEYLQARALPQPEGTALLTLDPKEVDAYVFDRLHQLPGRSGQLLVRPGLACISDHWVWRPCTESLSPFYPFKMVNYGENRLYVRSDGRLFTSLTTIDRGI